MSGEQIMIITNKTIVSFVIPEEYELAEKFKAQHPNWVEIVTSVAIGYKKEDTYAVDMRGTANER